MQQKDYRSVPACMRDHFMATLCNRFAIDTCLLDWSSAGLVVLTILTPPSPLLSFLFTFQYSYIIGKMEWLPPPSAGTMLVLVLVFVLLVLVFDPSPLSLSLYSLLSTPSSSSSSSLSH